MSALTVLFLLLRLGYALDFGESYEAWPLQFHCGIQSLRESGYLVYGVAVVQRLPYEEGFEPKVLHFVSKSNHYEEHAFCRVFDSAMTNKKHLWLRVADQDGLLVGACLKSSCSP